MNFLSRVVWSEGMHLGPHHFQTQSRYFEDTLWFLNSNLRQEPWGFLHFSLDSEALRNGLAILTFASGILPDGLIFDLPDCDSAPVPAQLKDLFSSTDSEIVLYLAIPPRQDQGLDCDLAGGAGARYSAVERTPQGRRPWPGRVQRLLCPKISRYLSQAQLSADTVRSPSRASFATAPADLSAIRTSFPPPAHRRLRGPGHAAPPPGPGHRRKDRIHTRLTAQLRTF